MGTQFDSGEPAVPEAEDRAEERRNTPDDSGSLRGGVHPQSDALPGRPWNPQTGLLPKTHETDDRTDGEKVWMIFLRSPTKSLQVSCPTWFIPAHAGNSLAFLLLLRPPSVHPRACGELTLNGTEQFEYVGSSPRMRGTRQISARPRRVIWFIPAHAGNSCPFHSNLYIPTVHPRACGELRCVCRSSADGHGSSPRMRGTLCLYCIDCERRRFIPAHAGNSSSYTITGAATPVHPRACGELPNIWYAIT